MWEFRHLRASKRVSNRLHNLYHIAIESTTLAVTGAILIFTTALILSTILWGIGGIAEFFIFMNE